MKGNEQVRRLTFCLMVVHRYSCKKCKNVFVQAVSTSDTDMVPIFLSSVYAPQSSTLVIMELTENELRFGRNDSMPKRAEKIFSGMHFSTLTPLKFVRSVASHWNRNRFPD